jgi:hypothetical protein
LRRGFEIIPRIVWIGVKKDSRSLVVDVQGFHNLKLANASLHNDLIRVQLGGKVGVRMRQEPGNSRFDILFPGNEVLVVRIIQPSFVSFKGSEVGSISPTTPGLKEREGGPKVLVEAARNVVGEERFGHRKAPLESVDIIEGLIDHLPEVRDSNVKGIEYSVTSTSSTPGSLTKLI